MNGKRVRGLWALPRIFNLDVSKGDILRQLKPTPSKHFPLTASVLNNQMILQRHLVYDQTRWEISLWNIYAGPVIIRQVLGNVRVRISASHI
jgi:hypothetical protein